MNDGPQKSPLVSYSYTFGAKVPVAETPLSAPPAKPPFVWRGVEYDIDALPWAIWEDLRTEFGAVPGWTFCRFARKVARASDQQQVAHHVTGIVNGPFGIYQNRYLCVGVGKQFVGHLSVLTHLPSGLGVALFTDDNEAIAAAIHCSRNPAWATVEAANDKDVYLATVAAWQAAGIMRLRVKAHDIDGPADEPHGPPLSIWAFEQDEPEKGAKLS